MSKPKTSYGRILSALVYQILLERTDEKHPLNVSSSNPENTTISTLLLEDGLNIEVNSRTISLTLEELKKYGLVIQKENSKKGGWYARREMDEESASILLLSLYGNNNLTESQIGDIELLLRPVLGMTLPKVLHATVPTDRPKWNKMMSTFFMTINDAIKRNKQVTYVRKTYDIGIENPNKKEPKQNTINPLGISYIRGSFYLLYTKRGKEDVYFMRLDNIGHIEEARTLRTLPEDFDMKEYLKNRPYAFRGLIEEFEIVINDNDPKKDPFDNVGIIKQYFGEDPTFTKDDKGFIHVHIRAPFNCFKYWYVQYAENFQVIKPKEMIEEVLHYADMMKKKNVL